MGVDDNRKFPLGCRGVLLRRKPQAAKILRYKIEPDAAGHGQQGTPHTLIGKIQGRAGALSLRRIEQAVTDFSAFGSQFIGKRAVNDTNGP